MVSVVDMLHLLAPLAPSPFKPAAILGSTRPQPATITPTISMENAMIENPAVVATTSNDTSSTCEKEKGSGKRYVFPKIAKDKLLNGNIVVTHPFLVKSTEAELAFCRLLAVEKPFIAPHGSKGTVWKAFVAQLNEQRDDDNKPLYDPPVTERYAKERVSEYQLEGFGSRQIVPLIVGMQGLHKTGMQEYLDCSTV